MAKKKSTRQGLPLQILQLNVEGLTASKLDIAERLATQHNVTIIQCRVVMQRYVCSCDVALSCGNTSARAMSRCHAANKSTEPQEQLPAIFQLSLSVSTFLPLFTRKAGKACFTKRRAKLFAVFSSHTAWLNVS